MPFIDTQAAATVRELREARGLSPEAMAHEIRLLAMREGWKLGTVDAFTIRRIEGNEKRHGRIPSLRVRVVIGLYLDVPAHEIWKSANRLWVNDDTRMVAA